MIAAIQLRELTLNTASAIGRPRYLSAASGLVRIGEFLYVVADDELQLGVFPSSGDRPGDLIRLFPGELPDSKKARKAIKPDLEALMLVPPFRGNPDGALLAIPSGSRPNRTVGALLTLAADGALAGSVNVVDFSPLFKMLQNQFETLNIEGAFIAGEQFCLIQRGNKSNRASACIRLHLPDLMDAVQNVTPVSAKMLAIQPIELGEIDGIPLSVTDAAALPDSGFVFTAVAEDSENAYDDGACAGAAIGIVGNDGRLVFLDRLQGNWKVEGISAQTDGPVIRLLLVTDADDANIPARLLSAQISNRR
jgi:hypothetical protein